MLQTIKRILLCGAIVAVVGAICYVIAIVTLFSSWNITVKEYSDTYKTAYGDVLTVTYEEFNFPDRASSTELINEETQQIIYFTDDPAVEATYLEECYSDENYNVYYFHKAFVFVNEQEMFYVPQKDLYEQCSLNYKKYPKLIKELILDGNRAITCLYAQFYLQEQDVKVQERIRTIAEISPDRDSTYYNSISELKFNFGGHLGCSLEELIAFAKEMAKKYDL